MQNTKYKIPDTYYHRAFTLIEMVTSLIILALMCSSVLVVISRCVASAADSTLRIQAFEVTRENMEKLLASDSVSQTTEFGISDKFPEIKWQTTVETFYEPITARMWIRGVCSAEYTNTAGEAQTVEITHWLTDVTKQQLLEILAQQLEENESSAPLVFDTIEEAAEYAGVNVETVEQWVDNGMPVTEDGSFVPDYLDVYNDHNGNPPAEALDILPPIEELVKQPPESEKPTEPDTSSKEDPMNKVDPRTGLTPNQLRDKIRDMDPSEVLQFLLELSK